MNEKDAFSEKLRSILITKGYELKASTLEREFNLHHYGKAIGVHAFGR
ncbi:hypothetical protein [uncultured Haemophilus sp.]|mgnify:FL=1|jgi:hypothetical protein|nr:hypothetical protein [uncultured Haemophilus sp.]